MTDLPFDLRVAARSLRRSPAFTLTALATLAVGIGLTTAIFSLVESTLLSPLPFREPSRLVQVWEAQPSRGVERNVVNPGNFMAWRENAKSFSGLSAIASWSVNLAGEGAAAERVPVAYVSHDFFQTLGAPLALGRAFSTSDVDAGAGDVAVISESLWRSRYSADRNLLGRRILLNGTPTTVVGVVAASADFPVGTQVWQPVPFGERARNFRGRYLQVLGRLAPGASLIGTRAEMQGIAARLASAHPDFDTGWTATVVPLDEQLFGDYRRGLWILLAATAVVLLLACANLSGLLLARNARRRHDLAVRGALGAGRSRIARHLLVESLLLAAGGGALALTLARSALSLFRLWSPIELPDFVAPTLDLRALGFAFAATLGCALLFGLAPALAAAREGLDNPLQEGGARALGHRSHRARTALVVAEVALSLALVAAAGLLVRSFTALRGVDPGFRVDHLLTARVDLAGPSYKDPQRQIDFFFRLERRLASSPGIESAGAISWLPLGGKGSATSYHALDRPAPSPGDEIYADVRVVTPGFFPTAGVRLVAGRLLGPQDDAEAPPVVVVNRFAAQELWPGEDPIGRELAMSWGEERRARVVGVVADLHVSALDEEPRGALFWSLPQLPNNFMSILVRTAGRPAAAAATLRRAVAELDPTIPAAAVVTMDDVIAHDTERQRFSSSLLTAFALVALLLAAIGLYGLLASAVSERRRELGVRMALGADGRRLLLEVVGRGLRAVGLGVLFGLPLVYATGKVVASLLFRTSPTDLWTLAAALLALLVVGATAGLLPALRAARTDPAAALRES